MNSPRASSQVAATTVYLEPASPSQSDDAGSLLDLFLSQQTTETKRTQSLEVWTAFLSASEPAEMLRCWFGEETLRRQSHLPWRHFVRQIQIHIARIDRCINSLVNAILHHPEFQKLEASWRGIAYLTECKERSGDAPIRIRLLNAKWTEIGRDFDRAVEFDQSQVFKKVYEEAIGTPGAEPFGVLLADYAVHPRPSAEHPVDDMSIVRALSAVGAAAFCPVVLNASPAMFSVDRFDELQHTINIEAVQTGLDFFGWQKLRESEDARFVSLAMPQMLMRAPYRDAPGTVKGFPFEETIASRADNLWGGAAFGFGEVLIRAFADSRWMADIRGAQRGVEKGGLVIGPAVDAFQTDSRGVADKPLTDLIIHDSLERELARLGFMPMCPCKEMPLAAYYSCPSVQKPKAYSTTEATANAKISAMLNHMLCVSRFAHYVKEISRNHVGGMLEASDLENILQNWLINYVTPDPDASARVKSERPLREANVMVRSIPGKPGEYQTVLHLQPHHEIDDLQAAVRLDAKLAPPRNL